MWTYAGAVSVLLLALFTPSAARAESSADDFSPKLINGDVVPAGELKQLVFFRNQRTGSGCSATVIGDKTILTAAHCGEDGDNVVFSLNGKRFTARIKQSPDFKRGRHDIAVGILSEAVPSDVKPMSVGGRAFRGRAITVAGFGCTKDASGRLVRDRQLRSGNASIVDINGRDILFGGRNSAILCAGDSGGLAFVKEGGQNRVLAVNSRGNDNFSINTRVDTDQSRNFLRRVAFDNGVTICGVTEVCDGAPSTTPPIADNRRPTPPAPPVRPGPDLPPDDNAPAAPPDRGNRQPARTPDPIQLPSPIQAGQGQCGAHGCQGQQGFPQQQRRRICFGPSRSR